MITFFTHCRPFVGEMDQIQRTAIASWHSIHKDAQIILIGDETTREVADHLRLEFSDNVKVNKWGTARVDSIFTLGDILAKHEIMCEVSADIVLSTTLLTAVEAIEKIDKPFVVGQRWDLAPASGEKKPVGVPVLHGDSAIDYFLYKRGTLGEIPPFGVGRTAYDPWLLWAAMERWGMMAIDATDTILAVHLNHPYLEYGNKEAMLASEERNYNHKLAKDTGCARWYNMSEAPYQMKRGIITLR